MEENTHLMLRGSGGYKDYYLVAVKGRIGIGFKILGLAPAHNATKYMVRVRTCAIDEPELNKLYGEPATAKIPPSPEFEVAWNGIHWGEKNQVRFSAIWEETASSSYAVQDKQLVVPGEISTGEIRTKWAEKLTKAVEGAGIVVLNEEQIAEILAEYEQAMGKVIYKSIRTDQIQQEAYSEANDAAQKTGIALSTSILTQEIYAKHVAEFPEDAKVIDGPTAAEDHADDGEDDFDDADGDFDEDDEEEND